MQVTNKLLRKSFTFTGMLVLMTAVLTSCASTSEGDQITGAMWSWAELVETLPASQSVVPDPEKYTLVLNDDNTLTIKADCNSVSGSYSIEGDALTIQLGPSTMAYCGDQSLDQLYLQLLEKVESYSLDDGDLILSLEADSGTMTFRGE